MPCIALCRKVALTIPAQHPHQCHCPTPPPPPPSPAPEIAGAPIADDNFADALQHSRALASVADDGAEYLHASLRNLRQALEDAAALPAGAAAAIPAEAAGLYTPEGVAAVDIGGGYGADDEETVSLESAQLADAAAVDDSLYAASQPLPVSAGTAGTPAAVYYDAGAYTEGDVAFDETTAPAAADAVSEADVTDPEALGLGLESGALAVDVPQPVEGVPVEAVEPEVLDAGTMEVKDGEDGFHDDSVLEMEAAPVDDGSYVANPDPYADATVASETDDSQGLASQPNPEDAESMATYGGGAAPAGEQLRPEAGVPSKADAAAALAAGAQAAKDAAEGAKKAVADKVNGTATAAAAKLSDAKAQATEAVTKKAAKLGLPATVGIAVGAFAALAVASAVFVLVKARQNKAAAAAGAKGAPRARSSAGGDVERGSRGGWRFSRGGAK